MDLRKAVMAGLIGALATAAHADPTPPDGMFIRAEATDESFQLRVTWKDFLDEDAYQLIANVDSTPGEVFEQPGVLANGWELVANLPAGTTEFVHDTISSQSYGICGLKEREVACVFPSNHATPTLPPEQPPEPASVESLQISGRGSDHLRVQWTQSSNTQYSRAEIRRSGDVVARVENDADQSVRFDGLQSNVNYTAQVCVRNAEQTSADETCDSTTARTLPLAPLAVRSVEVDQDDPDPRRRTIRFRYDNRQSTQVIGLAVRLIKDDAIVSDHYVFPDVLGEHEYEHTFTGLLPFENYEAWVIPYNQSGLGTSAGVGFTTPTEINLATHPLSGDSVMLRWLAPAVGEYTIQRRSGRSWVDMGSVRLTEPGEPRVILEHLDEPQSVRVTWKLAFLRSQSTLAEAAPLGRGVPELTSVTSRPIFLRDPMRFGVRHTVKFRATQGGIAEYVLQRRTATDWVTVDTIGSLRNFFDGGFADDGEYTMTHDTDGVITAYRVCVRRLLSWPWPGSLQCGASSSFASAGVVRMD
jgi:hypothetical protein